MHSHAIDVKSPLWLYRCKGEGETQMRRMLKEATYGGCGDGGPPSKIHASAGSGARNLAVVPTTTAPRRTTVT